MFIEETKVSYMRRKVSSSNVKAMEFKWMEPEKKKKKKKRLRKCNKHIMEKSVFSPMSKQS